MAAYRVEVSTQGIDSWRTNGQEFRSSAVAEGYATGIEALWETVSAWRVVDVSTGEVLQVSNTFKARARAKQRN